MQRSSLIRFSSLLLVVLPSIAVALLWCSPTVAGLPVTDTVEFDELDALNIEPGLSDQSVGPGELVNVFNGNFQVAHVSSPVVPLEQLSIGLIRSYNSHAVRKFRIEDGLGNSSEYIAGQSWVGLGWQTHLGRVVTRATYDSSSTPPYSTKLRYFEDPSGRMYRLDPGPGLTPDNIRSLYFSDEFEVDQCPGYDCVYAEDPCCTGGQEPDEPIPNSCTTAGCACPSDCPPPAEVGEDPIEPEHYLLTTPDGTTYRLERIVGEEFSPEGWITNHDRAGFYTTSIEDVHGNIVKVDYWRATNPKFPEAIKRVWSEQDAAFEITTQVCTASDDPVQCPIEGVLKSIHASGFKGNRAVAQSVDYEFHYSTASVQDSSGAAFDVPLLTKVELPPVGGVSPGEWLYDYDTDLSLEAGSAQYGPLLTRVTYPTDTVVEIRYGEWTSGNRESGGTTEARRIVGADKVTVFPDGIVGAPATLSHYSWEWSREFSLPACGDPQSSTVNSLVTTMPDGRKIEQTIYGHPCADFSVDWGPLAKAKTTVIYEGDGVTKLRSTETRWNSMAGASTGEHIEAVRESVETTFEDDDGGCFGGTPSEQKFIRADFRQRNDSHQSRMSYTTGNYFPTGFRRLEYTSFDSDDNVVVTCSGDDDRNVVGMYDFRYVEETASGWPSGNNKRLEESDIVFDCDGRRTAAFQKNEWTTPGTVLGADPSLDTTPANAIVDADDVEVTTAPDLTTGYLASETRSNGSQSYTTTYTWEHGTMKTVVSSALAFDSMQNVIDRSGLVSSTMDPSEQSTRFDYDELGRLTEVDPPDSTAHSERYVYWGLREVRRITSAGTELDFVAGDDDQVFSSELLDGFGRVVERRRAMPDGSRAVQIERYDQFGRTVFVSEWINESTYAGLPKAEWDSGDVDGDGLVDYRVTGIPLDSIQSNPWGTTVFYGEPDPGAPGNPLRITPDGVGRVRELRTADGSTTKWNYCGAHVEQSNFVRADITKTVEQSVSTRLYYDGFGRLVLVDAPEGSADASYSYDLNGKLIRVNLVDQLPGDPFQKWRDDQISDGQVREFEYDALGRLTRSMDPESGTTVVDEYDASGNPAVWRDELATRRGYFFQNSHDSAGRLGTVEKVSGTPSTPATADVDRVGASGGFNSPADVVESGSGPWVEGTLNGSEFQVGPSAWKQEQYSGCLLAPPGEQVGGGGLYIGDSCSYGSVPVDPQVVRTALSGVTRDDILTLKLWRQVRGGTGSKDSFKIIVTQQSNGDHIDQGKYLLELDQSQASFAKWRRMDAMRPGDLFSEGEWSEGTTTDLYLYIVFEKGDTQQSGLGVGLIVDDVFVGRRAVETIAEYSYDEDLCAVATPPELCADSGVNRVNGQLTTRRSYQSGRLLSEEKLYYKGRNGTLSHIEQGVDWAGVGELVVFEQKYEYSPTGQLATHAAPFQRGTNSSREYHPSYKKGVFDGIREGSSHHFIEADAASPSITYSPSGRPLSVHYANGTKYLAGLDMMSRLDWANVTGPNGAGSTQVLWDSGLFEYDGSGNIRGIDSQQYEYDAVGQLTEAHILPQAGDPDETSLFKLSYDFDPLGNMTTRGWELEDDPSAEPPAGMDVSNSYAATLAQNKNQIAGGYFAYDPNGNTTRTVGAGGALSATWDPQNRLTSMYLGQPDSEVVLVEFGSSMRYWENSSAPSFGIEWKDVGFRDGGGPGGFNWPTGFYGAGYDDAGDAANLILASSASGVHSVFTRADFLISDIAEVEDLFLGVDYDDGVVAWINGVEVYRSPEVPSGTPVWNSLAMGGHESSNGSEPDYGVLIDISSAGVPALTPGINKLAIGVWNDAPTSDDLVVVPRLSMNRLGGGHRLAEQYAYDASGYRLVRYPTSGDGRPVISIRDSAGRPISEYVVDPITGEPVLDKDYVYGPGGSIVERHVIEQAPAVQADSQLMMGSWYVFNVTEGLGASTFTVDIRTESGFVNQTTLSTVAGTKLLIPESEFSLGETNYLRIKPQDAESAYSAPVTLLIDPNITSQSINQVRATSVSWSGDDVFVSLALAGTTSDNIKVYFRRGDTGNLVVQTPSGLPQGQYYHTIPEQSLSVDCGSFTTIQGGVNSPDVGLPPQDFMQVATTPSPCTAIPPAPEQFIDYYHHRDHLGSLRAVTDPAGWQVSTHDYYPFGMEVFDPVSGPAEGSALRYTGHERDDLTGADYMKARYKLPTQAAFMSPDPIAPSMLGLPHSWNRYAYVSGNPIRFLDPAGLERCDDNDGSCVRIIADPPRLGPIPTPLTAILAWLVHAHHDRLEAPLWKRHGDKMDPVRKKNCGKRPFVPPITGDPEVDASIYDGNIAYSVYMDQSTLSGFGLWFNNVKPGGDWDFKFNTTKHTRINGKREYTQEFAFARNAGNFNAGATGAAIGLSRWQIEVGGGVVSRLVNGFDSGSGRIPIPFIDPGEWPYGDINDLNTAAYVSAGITYTGWYKCHYYGL